MKKGIIGNGGFGREVFYSMTKKQQLNTVFFVDDEYYSKDDFNTLPLSDFNKKKYKVIIAIADREVRESIVKKLPKNTKFFTFIHPTALIMSEDIEIGEGSFIGAYCVLTKNIKIGKHSLLNRGCQIGHDTVCGDFLSMMPGSIISGNCKIGNQVYIGTNSSIREKITLCDNVVIGLNTGVVRDIKEEGTYISSKLIKI